MQIVDQQLGHLDLLLGEDRLVVLLLEVVVSIHLFQDQIKDMLYIH